MNTAVMNAELQLVTQRAGATLILCINRPAVRNALNTEVLVGLGRGLLLADEDPDIRAVVLTGAGEQAFCSGMDLAEFSAGGVQVPPADEPAVARFRSFIRHGDCEVPVIGAANGSAVAGGFELLLACDLVIAAEGAQFGLPEVKRGLFAAGGGFLLGQRIPLAKALELALTGDPITAEEAARWGLVNTVVSGPRVLDEAISLADRITRNSPLGVRASKALVRMAATTPSPDLWEALTMHKQAVFTSDDAREGSLAFMEKRPPVWTGH